MVIQQFRFSKKLLGGSILRIAICPGSFDPVTNGHIDIFKRASLMFDEVIVGVFFNPNKGNPMFTVEQRVAMLEEATKEIPNIRIAAFSGLLNEYVKKEGAQVIVRGLRTLSDFEYEFQRALLIKKIDENIETVFMMTSVEHSYLSSSGMRELLNFGGDIAQFVPCSVKKMIYTYLQDKK